MGMRQTRHVHGKDFLVHQIRDVIIVNDVWIEGPCGLLSAECIIFYKGYHKVKNYTYLICFVAVTELLNSTTLSLNTSRDILGFLFCTTF